MKLSYSILAATLVGSSLVSGCAYESRAFDAEQAVLGNVSGDEPLHSITLGTPLNPLEKTFKSTTILLDKPPIRTAIYALQLSDSYKRLGDEAARNRDFSAAAIITLAGAAALGNASSISAKDAAIVLATGAVINEGVKYVNPGAASSAFYSASEAMACTSTAIASHVPINTDPTYQVTTLSLWYIRKNEVLLRTALERKTPDLSSVLKALNVLESVESDVAETAALSSVDLEALEASLKLCLPKEVPEET
ncbi:hypothetical protein [Ruegeria sp.]|uniref:hypothetical protein n=1 Tax=Ruegeria sp. TaxID=1879320 RepID=UPI003C7C67FC